MASLFSLHQFIVDFGADEIAEIKLRPKAYGQLWMRFLPKDRPKWDDLYVDTVLITLAPSRLEDQMWEAEMGHNWGK